MTESDIFIVTNTYRNGRDNVISPFYVFDNSHKALSAVLKPCDNIMIKTPPAPRVEVMDVRTIRVWL